MASSAIPLADYFWIAGIDSISYHDGPSPGVHVGSSIAEDGEPQEDSFNGVLSKAATRRSRQGSANRFSKTSADARNSIQTLDEIDGHTQSNRSSATIKPSNAPNLNGSSPGEGAAGKESFDFDQALLKFAAEREVFLDDLIFSAGAKTKARPPMINPRAERIRADDADSSGRLSPLRNIKGSIRRKISFREMNSTRKTANAARAGGTNRKCMSWAPFSLSAQLVAGLKPVLTLCDPLPRSIRPHLEATEQLQLRHPSPRTPEHRPRYASSQEALRACVAG